MDQGKSQQDVVNQHLQSLRVGELVQDKLHIPNVENVFAVQRAAEAAKTHKEKIRLPLISPKATLASREEISKAIVQCLQYSPDIIGISWKLGEDTLEISREVGANSSRSEAVSDEDVQDILMNVIRSRASFQSFDWEFGNSFIRISFENRQFA